MKVNTNVTENIQLDFYDNPMTSGGFYYVLSSVMSFRREYKNL